MTGRSPAGPGSRASHEAAKASSPEASIPNAAFTPGPWWAAGFSSIVGVPVCAQPDKTKNTLNVCGVAAPVSREENIANARLIAAAPDLYEALAGALKVIEGDGLTYPRKWDTALAKARDGQ